MFLFSVLKYMGIPRRTLIVINSHLKIIFAFDTFYAKTSFIFKLKTLFFRMRHLRDKLYSVYGIPCQSSQRSEDLRIERGLLHECVCWSQKHHMRYNGTVDLWRLLPFRRNSAYPAWWLYTKPWLYILPEKLRIISSTEYSKLSFRIFVNISIFYRHLLTQTRRLLWIQGSC